MTIPFRYALDLCKANLEALILLSAEKYLSLFNLIMTVPGIKYAFPWI